MFRELILKTYSISVWYIEPEYVSAVVATTYMSIFNCFFFLFCLVVFFNFCVDIVEYVDEDDHHSTQGSYFW